MIHSFFFSWADNLQTEHKKIKGSQLLLTAWLYMEIEVYTKFSTFCAAIFVTKLQTFRRE